MASPATQPQGAEQMEPMSSDTAETLPNPPVQADGGCKSPVLLQQPESQAFTHGSQMPPESLPGTQDG